MPLIEFCCDVPPADLQDLGAGGGCLCDESYAEWRGLNMLCSIQVIHKSWCRFPSQVNKEHLQIMGSVSAFAVMKKTPF